MGTQSEEQAVEIRPSSLGIRSAELSDAASIWRLVSASDALDTNSCYAYLLLCSDFSNTCLVSYDRERLAGFVVGYIPPNRPDVVFVWQIGVAPSYRGRGIGKELLSRLVDRAAADGRRYLEATITPGNQASQSLFRSLAESRGWAFATHEHFEAKMFGDAAHEPEFTIRIGPFEE